MTHEHLQVIWFILIFVLLAGYAVLDGFDFGVGMLHLLAHGDTERRISINAIAPVWDGNEVWLLTAGGALFAAFPPVYATVFTGFYLALMVLLVALIIRAVSMEFRSKVESATWRSVWDVAFFLGSFLPPLLLGVAFGNILGGVPLDAGGRYAGSFFDLLNPYALLVGVLTVVTFLMHGAIYLVPKTEGAHQTRIRRLVPVFWALLMLLYCVAMAATYYRAGFLLDAAFENKMAYVFLPVVVISIVAIRSLMRTGQWSAAFVASSALIVGMIGLAAAGLFPRLVPEQAVLQRSLDIYNSSSTRRTLMVMFVIALIGMPIVIAYTVFIHRVFRGKVVIGEESY